MEWALSAADATFAVLDLETTGVSPERDRIVEVGVVRARRGEVLSRWSTLVRSEVPVGASRDVHGIDDAALADAPTLAEIAGALAAQLDRATPVAHRAGFDRSFLAAAVLRGELPEAPTRFVDTAVLAAGVLGESGLASLARMAGAPAPTHRALPDAESTLGVLGMLVAISGVDAPDELITLSAGAASLRPSLHTRLAEAHARGETLTIVYRPPSGRAHADLLRVERIEPPYVIGTLGERRIRRTLRGDRIVRAWGPSEPRPHPYFDRFF